MLKFTSVSGSVRVITDITLTGTIIRTGITPDLIITGHTTGTAGIVIIAIIIVIPIVTGTSLTGIATLGWLEVISSQPNFFERKRCCGYPSRARQAGGLFSTLAKPPVWSQGLSPAHRSGILFSTAE